jgi:hypothetical protein
MPLVLPEGDRKRIASRLMVQPPRNERDVAEFARYGREISRVAGLPADVLLMLEALLGLAEQGNRVAQWQYMEGCKQFGVSFPRRFP